MRRLELPLPTTWPEDIDPLRKELDDTLTNWAITLEEESQRVSGADLIVSDSEGASHTLTEFTASFSDHDQLAGLADSITHELFLLLDGSRAMTGNLDMAFHNVDGVHELTFEYVAGTESYEIQATHANRLRLKAVATGEYVYLNVDASNILHVYNDLIAQHLKATGNVYTNAIFEYNTGSKTTIQNGLKVDNVYEDTSGVGVTVDSCLIKDGSVADSLLLGGAAETAFAKLADNELITGDWRFTGQIEFDNYVYFDYRTYFSSRNFGYAGNDQMWELEHAIAYTAVHLGIHANAGRVLNLMASTWTLKDHDHGVQTHPSLFGHADKDPDVSNNYWWSITHDATGMLISTGPNVGAGSVPATIDNYIMFAPRGAEAGRFEGSGDYLVSVAKKWQFRDAAIYIASLNDTFLDLVADGAIRLTTTSAVTLTVPGSGTLQIAGDLWLIDSGSDPRLVLGDSSSAGHWGGMRWVSASDSIGIGTYTGGVDTLLISEAGNVLLANTGQLQFGDGTFYLSQDAADYGDIHIKDADAGLRISTDAYHLLTISRYGAAGAQPTYPRIYTPAGPMYFDIAGTVVLGLSSAGAFFRGQWETTVASVLSLRGDGTDFQFRAGAGRDLRIYFDSANAVYSTTVITGTAKHYFGAAGGEDLVAANYWTDTTPVGGLSNTVLALLETTTPSDVTNYGKIYFKDDNKLYAQTGDGVEHEVAFA